MLTFSRTLKTTILLSGITALVALPAAAQEDPPPVPLEEGESDIAPAEVKLEEEAQPAPAPAEGAQAGAQAGAGVDAQAGGDAAATVTVGAEGTATDAADAGETVVLGTESATAVTHGGVDVGVGDWEFGYHGFFRAPMRIGIGSRDSAAMGLSTDDYSETTLHLPLVPDDQYLSWQKTNHSNTDWAEMFFSVGNSYARGTLAIEGYNFAQGSYAAPLQQFGIAQGYVEIMPELPYENVRLNWKVGAVWGRYGMAGRYDAGEYDTYLFGRTKGMGETLRAEIDVEAMTLAFEHGILTKRPDPSQYNTAKFTMLQHAHAFLEYEGLLAGLHFAHAWSQEEDREGQGISNAAYTPVNPATGANYTTWGYITGYGEYGLGSDAAWLLPDGSTTLLGAEVKYDAGPYGLGYIGFAHMSAKNALTVGNAMEWLHADGGGVFNLGVTNNYLDNPRCEGNQHVLTGVGCTSGGNGNISSVLFQYEFSVTNLLQGLEDGTTFWGEGMDFNTRLYAMFNKVSSDYDPTNDFYARNELDAAGNRIDNYSDHTKLKLGTDMVFSAFPAVAFGTRFDHVRPNSNLEEQSFSIFSPRLIFRSRWITREMIAIQYSRYFYSQRQCDLDPDPAYYAPEFGGYNPSVGGTGTAANDTGIPVNQRCAQAPSAPRQPEGWGATSMRNEVEERGNPVAGGNPNNIRPDVNVIQIWAQMWW